MCETLDNVQIGWEVGWRGGGVGEMDEVLGKFGLR